MRLAEDFLTRLHAAVNSHDAVAVAALCSADVVWTDPAATVPLRGREAVARFHRDGMTGPLNPPGFQPTGTFVEFETAEFSRLRAGVLCQHTVILDMLDLARQIGAVPKSGGVGERLGIKLQHLAAARMRLKRRAQD